MGCGLKLFGKKAAEIRHSVSTMLWGTAAPARTEMHRELDNGLESSALMACIQWLQRAVVEPGMQLVNEDGSEVITEHPLLDLLRQPNEYYTGQNLLQSLVYSYTIGGNNFWIVIDNGNGGPPLELWYAPHTLMEPDFPRDGRQFLTGWKYKPNGQVTPYGLEDVVHFRHGIDPENPRLGISPVHSVIRELWSDMDAGRLSAYFMKNNGIPGLVLSPEGEGVIISDVESAKADIMDRFSGANRGKPMVMSGPTKVHEYGFSPQQLDMSAIRNVGEERVTALLGIPAAVVGFGSGLEQTKVGATMSELRRLAWINGVIPILNNIAGEINRSLAPRFGIDQRLTFEFNMDEVEAVQEDRDKLTTRVLAKLQAGLITRYDAKVALGDEADEVDKIYLMPINVFEVPEGERMPTALPPPEKGLKHSHTQTEERLAASAPRATTIPAQLERMVNSFERALPVLQAAFQSDLQKFFESVGAKAEAAALEVLDEKDALDADRILEVMQMSAILKEMREVYQRQFLNVAQFTNDTIASTLGLSTNLPDTVAQAVVTTGGRRAGLVDIESQTKTRLFNAISELRAEGVGAQDIALRIREDVARGPWTSSEIRSRVIARTETKFAQNASTLARAKSEGMISALIFDDRLQGEGDEICQLLDGRIVSIQEAEQLAVDEHPNGSRSFTPIPESLREEMT